MISNYNIELIIQAVLDGESKITDSEGRDLIIFIGPSQVGKSTIINALLGVEFEIQDDDSLRPKKDNEIIAPIGDLRDGGISVTQLPTIYVYDSNFSIMDTQGFFDLRENIEMNIASSILMEMAIKKARSVRIVNLCKCDDFFNGLSTFHKYGEQLNQVITCDKEPIYFLFNRFHVPQKIARQFFEMTESQQNDEIKKRLKDTYQNLQNGKNKLMKQAFKKIYNKINFLKKNGIESSDLDLETENEEEEFQDLDTNICKINKNDITYYIEILNNSKVDQVFETFSGFDETIEKYKYMSFIENNFSGDFYGYIFPESKQSLANLMQNISKLPAINKNNLSFNGMTSEKRIFNRIFEKEISKEIVYMKKIKFAMKYTKEKIDGLINQIQNKILEYDTILNENEIPDNAMSQIQLNDEINKLIDEKTKNINFLQHLEEKLNEFINSPLQPFWEKSWDVEPGILLWKNYVCKYDDKIPFFEVKEYLGEYTSRSKVIIEKSPHFEVEYSSKGNVKYILLRVLTNFSKLFT